VAAKPTPFEHAARQTATALLAPHPPRLQHTIGVVERARHISAAVDRADISLLLAAAWLHDIGYAPGLHQTGFHPLDGACYLQQARWPSRLCAPVAYHSGARFIAVDLGLLNELLHFNHERGPLEDALIYADQTTGPTGQLVTLDQRFQEMLTRHGPDSPHARVHPLREPYLRAALHRVRHRLAETDQNAGRHPHL
jgi:hypothetical protein